MTLRGTALAALAVVIACATIGDETNFPGVVQTSGVGPFRPLNDAEAGDRVRPEGRILDRSGAFGRAAIAGDFLFYAQAPIVDDPPDRQEGLPEGDIDPAQVEAFAIHRGAHTAGADAPPYSFELGTEVLSATESWEGLGVYDPWVAEDGASVRLYYAADGGIGLAEAPLLDGAFTKVAGPLVEDARSPAVVRFGGEVLMFFEATDTGGIGLARSSDGRTFDVETRELDLALAGESDLAAPGAVVVTTPTGREVLRLYFEVVDAEDVRQIMIAATEDLSSWDRLETGVLQAIEDARDPVPMVTEDDVTLLVVTAPDEVMGLERRAVAAAVAPASIVLAEEPPAETM